jgi:cyclic beta-1,2-glucan synthetase
MAWACVAHSDSRFEVETLRRFVRSYQQVQPLTIGELWALAITLRIVLVENLRRLMAHIITSRDAVIAADQVADELLHVTDGKSDPDALVRRVLGKSPIAPAFLVQLVKRLRHQDPQVTPALLWLESLLTQHATTPEQMVQDEHQRQGAANVTVRNIITSMRLITDVNWQEFFESVSLVDEVLGAPDRGAAAAALPDALFALEHELGALSDAVARRYVSHIRARVLGEDEVEAGT